jgi:hypothetical protein
MGSDKFSSNIIFYKMDLLIIFYWTIEFINLKINLWGSKNDKISLKIVQNGDWKKSTVRENFGQILIIFGPKVTYRDLSKNRPHKKHCAWARTPPWKFDEIYRFFMFFIDFGVFNRAGKTVSKIGIYALPPQKSEFYRYF